VPTHRFCDEFAGGLGWMVEERIPRTSHALAVDGGVWLVDPVDVPGLDDRLAALGEPRGVVQLLDRHGRDCALLARRYAVPHHRLAGGPFEPMSVVSFPGWREVALWWPDQRVLVAGDALGTLPYFVEPGARLGVHPLLRLTPPRRLGRLEPVHVLVGHGEGIHGDEAADELRRALTRSRRGLPAALLNGWRWARASQA
jgi:hypothetical protein